MNLRQMTGITAEIVFDKRKQSFDTWKEGRSHGIGGSEVSTILGKNPFDSRLALWSRKTGKIPTFDGNNATYFGNLFEPVVRKICQLQNPALYVIECHYFLRHPEHSHHLVNPDGFLIAEDGNGLHEIKTVGIDDYRGFWRDEPPERVQYQVQWGLYITGLQWGMVSVLAGHNTYQDYIIHRDDDLIAFMVGEVDKFWSLVENDIQPEIDGSEATYQAMKQRYLTDDDPVEVILLPQKYAHLFQEYADALAAEKEVDERKHKATSQLMDLTREHKRAGCGGARFHWSNNKNGVRVPKITNPHLAMIDAMKELL